MEAHPDPYRAAGWAGWTKRSVLDTGCVEVQALPLPELEPAWDVNAPGIGRRNRLADHASLLIRILRGKLRSRDENRALMVDAGLSVRRYQGMGLRSVLIPLGQK